MYRQREKRLKPTAKRLMWRDSWYNVPQSRRDRLSTWSKTPTEFGFSNVDFGGWDFEMKEAELADYVWRIPDNNYPVLARMIFSIKPSTRLRSLQLRKEGARARYAQARDLAARGARGLQRRLTGLTARRTSRSVPLEGPGPVEVPPQLQWDHPVTADALDGTYDYPAYSVSFSKSTAQGLAPVGVSELKELRGGLAKPFVMAVVVGGRVDMLDGTEPVGSISVQDGKLTLQLDWRTKDQDGHVVGSGPYTMTCDQGQDFLRWNIEGPEADFVFMD
jgi:hypothetical protein